jgi:hypothetical protein
MFSEPGFLVSPEKNTNKKQLSVTDAQALVGNNAPEIIIQVLGIALDELPFIRGVRWLEEEATSFCHMILLMPESDVDNLYDRLWYADQLLTPIINASGKIIPRADAVVASYTGQALCDAIVEVLPIAHRVSMLPPRPAVYRDAYLALAMAFTREQTITATWDPTRRELIRYNLLTGLPAIESALDEMTRQGLLGQVFFDRSHQCSHCDSQRVIVREECNKCGSSNIREESLIHHYACSYQGPKSEFMLDGRMICPKCHERLRHYSVDYDASGTIIICGDCNHVAGDAEIGFVCMDCSGHTSAADAKTVDMYHYTLTQQGISAVVAGVMPSNMLIDNTPEAARVISYSEFKRTVIRETRRAKRYSRTVTSVLNVEIKVPSERIEQLGLTSMAALYQQITDVMAENLRECDVLAINGHYIFLILPETPVENLNVVVQKLLVMATNIFAVETIFRRMEALEDLENPTVWTIISQS